MSYQHLNLTYLLVKSDSENKKYYIIWDYFKRGYCFCIEASLCLDTIGLFNYNLPIALFNFQQGIELMFKSIILLKNNTTELEKDYKIHNISKLWDHIKPLVKEIKDVPEGGLDTITNMINTFANDLKEIKYSDDSDNERLGSYYYDYDRVVDPNALKYNIFIFIKVIYCLFAMFMNDNCENKDILDKILDEEKFKNEIRIIDECIIKYSPKITVKN